MGIFIRIVSRQLLSRDPALPKDEDPHVAEYAPEQVVDQVKSPGSSRFGEVEAGA